MADVMDERIRAIQGVSGASFILGAVLVSLALVGYPQLPPANETDKIVAILAKMPAGWWMVLHGALVFGFILVGIGFTGYGFQLHLKGSSGAASVVTACALIGATLWAAFLSAEFFVHPFLANLISVDPGLGTMLFTLYWFWKLGAIAVGAILMFAAVAAGGLAGTTRGILPVWLGWGGALFGVIGIIVYTLDLLASTATGAPINPLRAPFVRFLVGMPLQLWLVGVGIMQMMEWAGSRPVGGGVRSGGGSGGSGRRDTVQTTGRVPKAAIDQKGGIERQRPNIAPDGLGGEEPKPLPPPIP